MNYETRQALYLSIERSRRSKVISFIHSDRALQETQIAQDQVPPFVDLLDRIGPTKKISLLLHTNGGQTSAAWRLVNLIRTFCDELEVIVPTKALSSGTLMSLGADRILMTKQAVLGPIDPSVNHPLSPMVNTQMGAQIVPVSVEAVRGYLEQAKAELGVKNPEAMANLLVHLSEKIHPLVLGEIFRSREQIRYLARKLVVAQVSDEKKTKEIIDFLCADSGSHDYTINRREAAGFGLNIEKPTAATYKIIRAIHQSYEEELQLLVPYSAERMLGARQSVDYRLVRGLIESTTGGSYQFLTEGKFQRLQMQNPMMPMAPQDVINDVKNFEGWKRQP